MRIRLVTIGKPKLAYAQAGWNEYLSRLQRFHQVHVTQLADKHAYDAGKIMAELRGCTVVALEITGKNFSSGGLADFLKKRELDGRPLCFIIGGPEGLPDGVRSTADYQWSLGGLTLPHDLAMVVTLEALYRASTINAGLPYHK